MARCIKDSVPHMLYIKSRHTNVHCFPSGLLVIICVHHIRQPPWLSFLLFCHFLVFLYLLGSQLTCQLHQLPNDCTLSCIHMADKYKGGWPSLQINVWPIIFLFELLHLNFINFFDHFLFLFNILHIRINQRLSWPLPILEVLSHKSDCLLFLCLFGLRLFLNFLLHLFLHLG